MLVQFPLGPVDEGAMSIRNKAPALLEDPRGIVAIAGQPRLGASPTDAKQLAAILLERYQHAGPAFLAELHGEFAIAIRLAAEERTLVAIDRMGIERLAWSVNQGLLTLGTSALDVADAGLPQREANIDPQSIFSFMLCHMIPAPNTVFRDVQKLPPATALEFRGRRQRQFRYWTPDFGRTSEFDEKATRKRTLPTLRAAIERMTTRGDTGAFLSGGLDSSTVTGLLGEVIQEPAKAFSIGFGIDAFDEMAFARETSRHFNCEHFTYEVTADDIVEIIPKIASAFDEPFGNSSAVPTYACARLARSKGIGHLLAGDGGDELFGGNERYIRQTYFEKYRALPSGLRSLVLTPIADRLDPERSPFLLRKFSSYVRQARIPLPDRFESWNLIYREGPERVFANSFLRSVDPEHPLQLMRAVWSSCGSDELLDKMLWYDWKYTLADNDLRKVRAMCEMAGVHVSFPMLDASFVDLSMCVPSEVKIRRGELRSFFKGVVKDYLPANVVGKTKHGFGLPFGDWLKTHAPLRDLVSVAIDNLGQRGIFRPDFLDRVISEHKTGHAGYYGYAIWDLVMLEHWLARHGNSYGL